MSVQAGTVAYTFEGNLVSGVGVFWSDEEFEDALNGSLVDIVFDSIGTSDVTTLLESILGTDFDYKGIQRVFDTVRSPENWRVGEAIGEEYLCSHRSCSFPWSVSRDERKSGSSLPGADLVGFEHVNDSSVRFAFGEVKTSSEPKYPPGVMYGRTGLKQQLEDLRDKVDYEIYRYVDDYFLFYNDPCKKESILEKYELKLREYKMSLNHAKSELLERPVITLRTIYNIKIGDLLKDFGDAVFALKAVIKDDEQQEDSSDSAEIDWKEMGKQFSLMKKATDASKTKTHFKAIVKETEQDLKDILPYTLGLLTNRVDSYTKLLKKHIIKPLSQVSTHNSADLEDIFDNCIQTLANLIDISFFVYSMAPRVNSTIKLCRIITIVASLLNDARSPFKDRKHRVYKLVFDRVSDVMRFNKSHKNKEYAKLESLYLLVALKQLGKNYWIPEETLQEYVGLEKDEPKQDTLDYFQIIVILFYITKKKRYEKTREKIIKIANKRLQINDLKINKMKAESTMLLFDLLACPYLKSDEKKDIANSFGIQQEQHIEIQKVITFMNYWFTKWDHFNIKAELDAKKSSQVY